MYYYSVLSLTHVPLHLKHKHFIEKKKKKKSTKIDFVPKRARKLKNSVWSISSLNESSDEDSTHDRLMGEDVDLI